MGEAPDLYFPMQSPHPLSNPLLLRRKTMRDDRLQILLDWIQAKNCRDIRWSGYHPQMNGRGQISNRQDQGFSEQRPDGTQGRMRPLRKVVTYQSNTRAPVVCFFASIDSRPASCHFLRLRVRARPVSANPS